MCIKPIEKGEKFDLGVNFGSFRSKKKDLGAMHPDLTAIHGRRSNRSVKVGDGIGSWAQEEFKEEVVKVKEVPKEALLWLGRRTAGREERGVEGKSIA